MENRHKIRKKQNPDPHKVIIVAFTPLDYTTRVRSISNAKKGGHGEKINTTVMTTIDCATHGGVSSSLSPSRMLNPPPPPPPPPRSRTSY